MAGNGTLRVLIPALNQFRYPRRSSPRSRRDAGGSFRPETVRRLVHREVPVLKGEGPAVLRVGRNRLQRI